MKALWVNVLLFLNGALDLNIWRDFSGSPIAEFFKIATGGAPGDKLIPALYNVNSDLYLLYGILRAAPAFTDAPAVAMVALMSYLFQIVSSIGFVKRGQADAEGVAPGCGICVVLGSILAWEASREGLDAGFYDDTFHGNLVAWPAWLVIMLFAIFCLDFLIFCAPQSFSFLYLQTLQSGADDKVATCLYEVSGELQLLHALVRGAALLMTCPGTTVLAIISFLIEVSSHMFIWHNRHSSLSMVAPLMIICVIYSLVLAWQACKLWNEFGPGVWCAGFGCWILLVMKWSCR